MNKKDTKSVVQAIILYPWWFLSFDHYTIHVSSLHQGKLCEGVWECSKLVLQFLCKSKIISKQKVEKVNLGKAPMTSPPFFLEYLSITLRLPICSVCERLLYCPIFSWSIYLQSNWLQSPVKSVFFSFLLYMFCFLKTKGVCHHFLKAKCCYFEYFWRKLYSLPNLRESTKY